ncbi:hypothetical protein IFM89_004564 [Coptis chinensis]|uniref:Cell wall hydroxyproline-rich glycoprotein n=1 Tax=Coptis chinensis TaxID=261450 RepID=A0A835H3E3_9MAGN|nr:hypothetical protein IFM89_004564 [Coptis chinensis]
MQASGCCLVFFLLFSSSLVSFSFALSGVEVSNIARRQLLTFRDRDGNLPDYYEYTVYVPFTFPNSRLRKAYISLQALKNSIFSDPFNTTGNWVGENVCAYTGVFCAPALDDESLNVVAGLDINHADIAGHLPAELGLLGDLALFHINSNRFCGIIPKSFSKLRLLYELDVSNNRFVGPFPDVVLDIPELTYLDLRYNDFEGSLPPALFNKKLDALFLNDNRFTGTIPENLGIRPRSLITFANNKFSGCIPSSIGKMTDLNEIIFLNNAFSGCLPPEIGLLKNVTVLDLGSNSMTGILPNSLLSLTTVV